MPDNGDFLTLTVWLGKSDPKAKVSPCRYVVSTDVWETVGGLAAYRTADVEVHIKFGSY